MFLLTNSNIAKVVRRNIDFESPLSSLNVPKGTLLRQRKLENNWFFKCICQRCQVGLVLEYYSDVNVPVSCFLQIQRLLTLVF